MTNNDYSAGRRRGLYDRTEQRRWTLRNRQRTRRFRFALPPPAEKSRRVSFSYSRSSEKRDGGENGMGEAAKVHSPSHSHGIKDRRWKDPERIESREKITARHCVTLSLSQFCVIISSHGKVLKAPTLRKGREYKMACKSRRSVARNVSASRDSVLRNFVLNRNDD